MLSPTLKRTAAAGVLLVAAACLFRLQHHAALHPLPRPAVVARPPITGPRWRSATAAERRTAIASIAAQMQAFRRGDFRRAVLYQSSGLKRQIPSVARFRAMMKGHYPQFVHPRSTAFGPAWSDAGGQHVAIRVAVIGEDGVRVRATYLMVMEKGVYRVDSVFGGHARQPELINV